MSLYAELTSGLKVSEFLLKYREKGISSDNIKFFIEFGLLNNLIYRMHKYATIESPPKKQNYRMLKGAARLDPDEDYFNNGSNNFLVSSPQLRLAEVKANANFGSSSPIAAKFKQFEQILEGENLRCFDDICVELEIPLVELERKLKEKSLIFTFYK